jgi:hypothetical protein
MARNRQKSKIIFATPGSTHLDFEQLYCTLVHFKLSHFPQKALLLPNPLNQYNLWQKKHIWQSPPKKNACQARRNKHQQITSIHAGGVF